MAFQIWQFISGVALVSGGIAFARARGGGTIHEVDEFSDDPAVRHGVDRPTTWRDVAEFRALGLALIAIGSMFLLAAAGIVSDRVFEQTMLITCSAIALGFALFLVIRAPDVTATIRRTRESTSPIDDAEGLSDAVGNVLGRLVPASVAPYLGAVTLLAAAAGFGAEALHEGASEGPVEASNVALGVIAMVVSAAVALLLIVGLVAALFSRDGGDALAALGILGLYAAGTAVAWALGLLDELGEFLPDEWVEVLDWVRRQM